MDNTNFKSPISPPFSANMSLKNACEAYLKRRSNHLAPRSREMYEYHFRVLQKFFNPDLPLSSLHEQHFRDYQQWRVARKTGPSLINHELGALAQILSFADLWHPISKYYEPLPQKNWAPPKVMSVEEEERFFRFAKQNPGWAMALHCAQLSANTTIVGCELRTLKLENMQLKQDPPVIQLPTTVKNRNRVRGVPLNEVALSAVHKLLALAKERGSSEPKHYLIPFRIKRGLYDPNRPASPHFIRYSFRSIARAAGLKWLTPRSFRHQAITKLLESGAPDETVRAIAGHGSEKAMRFYSHIRTSAKKKALDLLIAPTSIKRKAVEPRSSQSFQLLQKVRDAAQRLGIPPDAAIELVLTYERGKRA